MAKMRLSDDEYRLLSQCPLGTFSSAAIRLFSDRPAIARKAWNRLQDCGLITGSPGVFNVRWGLLSIYQYERVRKEAKNASKTMS